MYIASRQLMAFLVLYAVLSGIFPSNLETFHAAE